MHSNGGDKPVRDMCVSGYGLYSQETLKVSYSDVGEGGVVAVNCGKNTIFPEHPVPNKIVPESKTN